MGLRPAEKLYEELLIGANASGTSHPRILRAREAFLPKDQLNALIAELRQASEDRDRARLRDVLMRAVGEYQPHNGIDDLVWDKPAKPAAKAPAASGDKVVNLPRKSS